MTKRGSQLADYFPHVLHPHGPDHELYQPITCSTTSIFLYNSTTSSTTGTPLFQLPSTLQPGEYRQKNAHTTIFKIFEYGEGPAELRAEGIDSNGRVRRKTLETYFFGIIGHRRDAHGQSMNTWGLCQQLSNYWREWFGLPTHGAGFPAYQPVNQTQTNAQSSSWTSTRGPMTAQQVPPTSQQIPAPILQLAWLLFSLIDQNRDVLSNLSAQLAIMSNMLAQSHAANQEIPDDLADDST